MDNRKIIGYTLINGNLRKAFEQIAFDGPPSKPYKEYEGAVIHVDVNTLERTRITAAGVQHWFAPVYARAEHTLPKRVDEIDGRDWYINEFGQIGSSLEYQTENNVSTKERAEAFLALMQLVELRDAWNRDWKADWGASDEKYCITNSNGKAREKLSYHHLSVLPFKSEELRDRFLEQFRDLIETAKELL